MLAWVLCLRAKENLRQQRRQMTNSLILSVGPSSQTISTIKRTTVQQMKMNFRKLQLAREDNSIMERMNRLLVLNQRISTMFIMSQGNRRYWETWASRESWAYPNIDLKLQKVSLQRGWKRWRLGEMRKVTMDLALVMWCLMTVRTRWSTWQYRLTLSQPIKS